MSTLIAVYGADGNCIARCDVRCYDAIGDDCNCICRGRCHKQGIAMARAMAPQIIRELTREEIAEFLSANGHPEERASSVHITRGPKAPPRTPKKPRATMTEEERAAELLAARGRNAIRGQNAMTALRLWAEPK